MGGTACVLSYVFEPFGPTIRVVGPQTPWSGVPPRLEPGVPPWRDRVTSFAEEFSARAPASGCRLYGYTGPIYTGRILLHPGINQNFRFFVDFSNFVFDPIFIKNSPKSKDSSPGTLKKLFCSLWRSFWTG